jgi:hypothetical protein
LCGRKVNTEQFKLAHAQDEAAGGQFTFKQLAKIILFRKLGNYMFYQLLPSVENTLHLLSNTSSTAEAENYNCTTFSSLKTTEINYIILSQLLFPEHRYKLDAGILISHLCLHG